MGLWLCLEVQVFEVGGMLGWLLNKRVSRVLHTKEHLTWYLLLPLLSPTLCYYQCQDSFSEKQLSLVPAKTRGCFVPVPVGISRRLHSQLTTDITVDVEFRVWLFLVTLCIPVLMEASVFPSTVLNSFIYVPSRMRLPMFCLNFPNLGCYLSLLLLFFQLHSLIFLNPIFVSLILA